MACVPEQNHPRELTRRGHAKAKPAIVELAVSAGRLMRLLSVASAGLLGLAGSTLGCARAAGEGELAAGVGGEGAAGQGGAGGLGSGGGVSSAGGSAGAAPTGCVGEVPPSTAWDAAPGPKFKGWDNLPVEPYKLGAAMPGYQLADFQPHSCGARTVYGLDVFRGKVTVAALLAGW